MTDAYSVGDQPPSQGRGPGFRGMSRSRRNPQTGQIEREVWVQGQGYLPEGSIASYPQQDREWLERGRAAVAQGRRNSQLAQQFSRQNRTTGTGELAALPVPDFMQSAGRQRLEGLTNQMVRANIAPGTSGTMNSVFEQILARQQYPTTGTVGPVNAERTMGMMVDEEELTSMLSEAEQWARQHRGLEGFDVHWTRNRSQQVRDAAARRIRSEFARMYPPSGGQQQRQGPRLPAGVTQQEWEHMTPEERALFQ